MKNPHEIYLNFSGKDSNVEYSDEEEVKNDILFAISDYFEEVEEIDSSKLKKEISIDVEFSKYSDTDSTPESFNHETNTVKFKEVNFQVKQMEIELKFSGKESSKIVDLYMDGIVETIDDNISYELEDKSIKLASQENKNRSKNRSRNRP